MRESNLRHLRVNRRWKHYTKQVWSYRKWPRCAFGLMIFIFKAYEGSSQLVSFSILIYRTLLWQAHSIWILFCIAFCHNKNKYLPTHNVPPITSRIPQGTQQTARWGKKLLEWRSRTSKQLWQASQKVRPRISEGHRSSLDASGSGGGVCGEY